MILQPSLNKRTVKLCDIFSLDLINIQASVGLEFKVFRLNLKY